MPDQIPTSRVPERSVPSVAVLAVFAVLVAAIVGFAVLARPTQRPAPSVPNRPSPARTAAAVATSAAPTTTVSSCMATTVDPVADPVRRHPRDPVPTGFETLAAPSGGFSRLVTDGDGTLWGYGAGRLLRRSVGSGTIRTWTFADDTAFDAVGIAPAAGGGVWVFGPAGLAWFDGTRFRDVVGLPMADRAVSDALESPDGALWMATWTGTLWRWDGRLWHIVEDCLPDQTGGVTHLAVDTHGGVWVSRQDANPPLARFDGNTWTHYGLADFPSLTGNVFALESAPDGSIWVGTDRGLTRIAPSGSVTDYGGGFAATTAIAAEADGSALVSVGTPSGSGSGEMRVVRVSGQPSAARASPDLLAEPFALWIGALRESPDGVFASVGDDFLRLENGRWTSVLPPSGGPSSYVGSVVARSREVAWVGGDQGVWGLSGNSWTAPMADGAVSRVFDLALDSNGRLWVAAGAGMWVAEGEKWPQVRDGPALSVAPGRGATAWFGLGSGRVEHVRLTGHALAATPLPSAPIGDVQTIAVGLDGSVWAGSCACDGTGSDGLVRYDGSAWHVVNPVSGAAHVGATSISVAADGSLWAALTVQDASGYTSWAVGRLHGKTWTIYDQVDGVPSEINSLAVGPDGAVWIAGDGLARLDGGVWTKLQQGHMFARVSVGSDGAVFVIGPSGVARVAVPR